MACLFDGPKDIEDMGEICDQMEVNCPHPRSNSKGLWKLRHATGISPHSTSKEIMLEKAVANLAKREHMPDWFNQCPAASGIGDSGNKRSSVDLVHWDGSNRRARLVELKWTSGDPRELKRKSGDPRYALRQVLRYGAAYLFCRIHRNELPLRGRPLMDARHVSLEVAAPARHYRGCDFVGALVRKMGGSIDAFIARSGIDGLTMSLDALVFPRDFDQIPFADGEGVKRKCDTTRLTPEGGKIRDAFAGLTPIA